MCGGLAHMPALRVFLGQFYFYYQNMSLRKSIALPCFPSIPIAPAQEQGYSQRNRFMSFAEGMNNFYLEMKKEKVAFHQSLGFGNSGYLATKIIF